MIKWLGHSTRAVNVEQITPSPVPPALTQSTLATPPPPPPPLWPLVIIPVDLINIVFFLNNDKTTKQEKTIARKLYLVSS